MESDLTTRTYLVNNSLTAADVALYGALHPVVVSHPVAGMHLILIYHLQQSQLQPEQYYSHPAITRYFDHIQSRQSVRKAADGLVPAFAPVTFDIDNMPKLERKPDPPKKKEKAVKPAVDTESAAPVVASKKSAAPAKDAQDAGTQKKEKKEKKEKVQPVEGGSGKKSGGGGGGKIAAEDAGEPVPSMIDLRVGHIVDST